jgi:hypothetical protein
MYIPRAGQELHGRSTEEVPWDIGPMGQHFALIMFLMAGSPPDDSFIHVKLFVSSCNVSGN